MPAKTNATASRKAVYAKNKVLISRVTVDGIILAALAVILAIAAFISFNAFLDATKQDNAITTSTTYVDNTAYNNASETEKMILQEIEMTRDAVAQASADQSIQAALQTTFIFVELFYYLIDGRMHSELIVENALELFIYLIIQSFKMRYFKYIKVFDDKTFQFFYSLQFRIILFSFDKIIKGISK